MLTDFGKNEICKLMYGSGNICGFMALGSGSGTVVVTQSGLVYENLIPTVRRVWSTRDISTVNEVTYTFDWGATELSQADISGLTISEFGLSAGSTPSSSDCWSRDTIGSISCGSANIELQVQYTLKVF